MRELSPFFWHYISIGTKQAIELSNLWALTHVFTDIFWYFIMYAFLYRVICTTTCLVCLLKGLFIIASLLPVFHPYDLFVHSNFYPFNLLSIRPIVVCPFDLLAFIFLSFDQTEFVPIWFGCTIKPSEEKHFIFIAPWSAMFSKFHQAW